MTKPGRKPHARREEALQMLREGQSVEDVARAVGVHPRTATRWARMVAVVRDSENLTQRQPSMAMYAAVPMALTGATQREIAVHFGVSHACVNEWFQDQRFQQALNEARADMVRGVQDRIMSCAVAGLKVLREIAEDAKQEGKDRVAAAKALTDIGFGKAPAIHLEITGADGTRKPIDPEALASLPEGDLMRLMGDDVIDVECG